MVVLHEENNRRGSFYVEVNGKRSAEMTYYFPAEGIMLINHTKVDKALQGKNIGAQLVESGVDFARTRRLKIVPECPYVRSVLEKNTQYDDVWK